MQCRRKWKYQCIKRFQLFCSGFIYRFLCVGSVWSIVLFPVALFGGRRRDNLEWVQALYACCYLWWLVCWWSILGRIYYTLVHISSVWNNDVFFLVGLVGGKRYDNHECTQTFHDYLVICGGTYIYIYLEQYVTH